MNATIPTFPDVISREMARKFLGALGWQLVHTWEESHGNGGSDTYERLAPMQGFKGTLFHVSFNRDGNTTGLRQEHGSQSYLLAKEIMADEDWESTGKVTSACCTASYETYKPRREWNDAPKWRVRVESVAGHGVCASWCKEGSN